MYSVLRSYGLNGLTGFAVAVEADISGGLPAFSLVGLPDSAVRESGDRVRAAVKNLGFKWPDRHITVNLAPADVRKTGPVYDLPLLLAVLTLLLALSACAARQTAPDTQDTPAAETTGQPDASEQAGEEQASEEQQPAQEAKRVEPMPESLDLNALTDATVAVSFGADDISETDGKTELTLTIYDYDIYDMVDIAQLAVGDTIVVDGKDMVVTSREGKDGFVTINGGLEQGGVDLTSDDSGVYYAVGMDDAKSYHELGRITVPVAEGFVLTDNSDLEHPDETYAASDLAKLAASEPGFTANNTLATIEHGKLTVLARSYTP